VNNQVPVNIVGEFGSELERDLAYALGRLLNTGSWLRRWRIESGGKVNRNWDLRASGPIPGGGKAVLCVECKSLSFQPSQFSTIAARACSVSGTTIAVRALGMPRVSPRMADLCQRQGWGWFDLAGNCRIEIPDVFLVERSGRQSQVAVARSRANLGTPEAGRVIRALLAPENAGHRWTQREIVSHFGGLVPAVPPPSLSLVNKIVQHLREQAVVEQQAKHGFQVRDHEGLLTMWRSAYRFDRHSRRRYFTLLQGRALQARLHAIDRGDQGRLAYASFSAADIQAPTVRQPRTWLYVDPNAELEFQSAAEAKIVDSGENLIVLIPDDKSVFYRVERANDRAPCTNPVQTYVDLAQSGARGEEAADAILDRRLKSAWSITNR
jgi:hypothetical protein